MIDSESNFDKLIAYGSRHSLNSKLIWLFTLWKSRHIQFIQNDSVNELWMLNELWNISKIKNCITPQTLLLLRNFMHWRRLNCIIGKHENISLWTPKKIAFHYELKKKAAEIEYASMLLLGPSSQCLKIIKKVAFWTFSFWWPFYTFLMNFCPINM